MAGSSPGTSGRPPSLSGEMSGACEACPSPCNRRCAPLECTVELPKEFSIGIHYDEVKNCDYLKVGFDLDGKGEKHNLSLDNFVRTISSCAQVEKVGIFCASNSNDGTLKALCNLMKSIPSLKYLRLSQIDSSLLSVPVSVSDAEAIFSVLGANNTLQKCAVRFSSGKPTEAAIVQVLLDALLQNQVLQQFTLTFFGHKGSRSASKEVVHDSGVMRELSRYIKAPTNVLTRLEALALSDDEATQLADMLGDNKQLRSLKVERRYGEGMGRMKVRHGEGMGRMGEALRTNTVLEDLYIFDTPMGGEEMKALVGALIFDATSGLQLNTHLHSLRISQSPIQGKEGMEQLATLLRSNTSLLSLVLFQLDILQKRNGNVAEYAEMLFTSLQSNASLESLGLGQCTGNGGKHMLGMIMDMLLHNHTWREIDLSGTGLEKDGDAEVVYAELRTRGKLDRKLEQAIWSMCLQILHAFSFVEIQKQVYLHDKYDSRSYKIYLNIISFSYNDINVFITRKDGSINIMSQSSGDGDHDLHKMIINHINNLRQKPTLGCPGVILQKHSIWPRCVEHPLNGTLQSVSKKHLIEMVLRTGDLKWVLI